MTEAPLIHREFSLERQIVAPPDRAYHAWTDPAARQHWFVGPHNWQPVERRLDLTVGGEEFLHGRFENGIETIYTARYHVVVPDVCLVYVYDMHVAGQHLSVSLASIRFAAADGGTRMQYTEQAVYLGGNDGSDARRQGIAAHLDRYIGCIDTFRAIRD